MIQILKWPIISKPENLRMKTNKRKRAKERERERERELDAITT